MAATFVCRNASGRAWIIQSMLFVHTFSFSIADASRYGKLICRQFSMRTEEDHLTDTRGRNRADDGLNPPRDFKQIRVAAGTRVDLQADRHLVRG